jgi:hypothetical protein
MTIQDGESFDKNQGSLVGDDRPFASAFSARSIFTMNLV